MAIGSPCFMSRFSNLAFHFFQSPLVSASPSPALPNAKKTTTTTTLAAKSEKEFKKKKTMALSQGHGLATYFPFPHSFFVRGWGGRHRLSGTFSSQQKRAMKTISCGQYFTEIFKRRDNYEIILWVPISSRRLQSLPCRKKKALHKLIIKKSQNFDLPIIFPQGK